MYYDCERGDYGRVYDALGNELLHVRCCDTESGCAVQFEVDELGKFLTEMIGPNEYVKIRIKQYPAPLRFERESAPWRHMGSNP